MIQRQEISTVPLLPEVDDKLLFCYKNNKTKKTRFPNKTILISILIESSDTYSTPAFSSEKKVGFMVSFNTIPLNFKWQILFCPFQSLLPNETNNIPAFIMYCLFDNLFDFTSDHLVCFVDTWLKDNDYHLIKSYFLKTIYNVSIFILTLNFSYHLYLFVISTYLAFMYIVHFWTWSNVNYRSSFNDRGIYIENILGMKFGQLDISIL